MREKTKGTNIAITAVAVLVAVIAGFLAVRLILIPTKEYNKAVELRASGNEAEAYAIFDSLGNFKDATLICNQYDYAQALAELEAGRYTVAYNILSQISGYPEAEGKASELLSKYPSLGILGAASGDTIHLGTYEQDNNFANGPEDIEWTVLMNEDGILYAVSKYVLDAKVYNTHNGDGSTLKIWLKDVFHDSAFGDLPTGFVSKVGMLSRDDMSRYGAVTNTRPEWTAYAKAQNPENHYYDGYCWWLDGDYFHGFGDADVLMSIVTESGYYTANSSSVTSVNGVRPAIIVSYRSYETDFYADDYADMENAGITTRTEDQVDAEVDELLGNRNSSGKTECSRCSGTGKVTKHFGNSWNKRDGYRYGEKCGGCGGTGYID